ncbi:MAG TPA: hypothetical protein VH640_23200 [Bryobacteraceae bacterium]
MTPFLDDCDRLQMQRGRKEECRSTGWNKWRYANRHYEREGIDRPDRSMVIVMVVELAPCVLRRRYRNAIEMRVDQPGVIVIARAVFPMNVLERRQNEGRQQSYTRR